MWAERTGGQRPGTWGKPGVAGMEKPERKSLECQVVHGKWMSPGR
jgi:hypothetical protein